MRRQQLPWCCMRRSGRGGRLGDERKGKEFLPGASLLGAHLRTTGAGSSARVKLWGIARVTGDCKDNELVFQILDGDGDGNGARVAAPGREDASADAR